MRLPVNSSEEDALRDLGTLPSRPDQLERDHSLPFDRLSWDEFEIFCYLLLRREYPGEDVIHYGKTADCGLDIIHRRAGGGVDLFQCKRYRQHVGLGEIREELAKLFKNFHSGEIPDRPIRVTFFVARDLTSPARQILTQKRWIKEAHKSLSVFLKIAPPPDLLDFAHTWWPVEGIHSASGVDLTERAERHPDLVDKFFKTKKVIEVLDGKTRATLKADMREAVTEALVRGNKPSASSGIPDKTWEKFFTITQKQEEGLGYLTDWPGLTPEDRFEAPREFPEIRESVDKKPMTILIGPPAAGKTFVALQILWEAFKRGSHVRWIAPITFVPTDGPIPAANGPSDMRQRIQSLATKLGIKGSQAPLDHHEFITVNLEKGSTIYIEDPFGKRDEEFDHSLHTYSFFDLDECVEAISEGANRTDCHILLSSREGLFDRWQAERTKRGIQPLPAKTVRISGDSYTHEQLERLAIRLAQARGMVNPEDIAFEICSEVELPYEVENVLRALPPEAEGEQAAVEAIKYRDGLKPALRQLLVAKNEQEVLFLVVLACRCTDPKTRYLRLHQATGLSDNPELALSRLIERFRSVIVRRPAFSFMDYGPDADEEFAPTHPVVGEVITEYLQTRAIHLQTPLEHLACALPEDALDRKSAADGANIALYLLSLGIGCQPGPSQDAILTVLLERGGFSLHHVRELMQLWDTLRPPFNDRLLAHLKSGLGSESGKPSRSIRKIDGNTRFLLVEMASTLSSIALPPEDAWRITKLLFRKEVFRSTRGPGLYSWSSPWGYALEHLEDAPKDVFGALEQIAKMRPDLFLYILGEVAVANWKKLPDSYKAAFFSESSLRNSRAQENALNGIARHWDEAPRELRELFVNQSSSSDPEIRSAVATAAWIYRRSKNSILDNIFLAAARDVDVTVPLGIMHSLGDEEADQRFANSFLERADATLAAEMLHDLLRPSGEHLPGWKLDLARECLVKGGERAWSVLALLHFADEEAFTDPLYNWKASIAEEPESIRLGALWAYGRSSGRSPLLDPDEVFYLVNGLSGLFRGLILAYFSAQMNRLPAQLQAILQTLEDKNGEDGDAIRIGKDRRGADTGNNPWSFLSSTERASRLAT